MKKLGVLLICLVTAHFASAHEHPKAAVMPKDFETLKKLVGTWEGKAEKGDEKETVKVIYELTSGGTAITEKMDPGTPHEMITIYYKEGNSLGLTHYCAMGNHPEMKLKRADAKSLAFEMTEPKGVSSMKETHMHALTLTLADNNTLKQEWVNFENGKKGDGATFNLKRKM